MMMDAAMLGEICSVGLASLHVFCVAGAVVTSLTSKSNDAASTSLQKPTSPSRMPMLVLRKLLLPFDGKLPRIGGGLISNRTIARPPSNKVAVPPLLQLTFSVVMISVSTLHFMLSVSRLGNDGRSGTLAFDTSDWESAQLFFVEVLLLANAVMLHVTYAYFFPTLILLDMPMRGMSATAKDEHHRRHQSAAAPHSITVTSTRDAEDDIEYPSADGLLMMGDITSKPPIDSRYTPIITMASQVNLISSLYWNTKLLKSILPDSIIARLHSGQKLIADKHESVSILFSDIVGYTELGASMETPELLVILNSMFTAFDRLSDKHGVYKVETIGDAYMAAAGHCEESAEGHAHRLIRMARDMIRAADKIELPDGTSLRIRVGIHTGPAYAGVVGEKCPRYCFFGDTVNTASRMESTSFPQCIQVSEPTFLHASATQEEGPPAEAFAFAALGARAIKGKGDMPTFLVKCCHWEEGRRRLMGTAGQESPPASAAPTTVSAASADTTGAAALTGSADISKPVDATSKP